MTTGTAAISQASQVDLDAERALLGCLLLRSEAGDEVGWWPDEVFALVTVESFSDPNHRKLFSTILDSYSDGGPMDIVTMYPALRASGGDELANLTITIAESVPSVATAVPYARRVLECWQLRRLVTCARQLAEESSGALANPLQIVSEFSQQLDRIGSHSVSTVKAIPESELLLGLHNPATSGEKKIVTGIGDLNHRLDGGLERGTLTVIGARPSCGKTSLGLGLCVANTRATDGVPSLFVSAEMTAKQIGERLLSMRTGLPVRAIRGGLIDQSEFDTEQNGAVKSAIAGHPMYIVDQVKDVLSIIACAKQCVRRYGIGLIIVDYLGLLDLAGTFDRRDLKMGRMVQLFKSFALTSDVVVVVLEQLSRASVKENRKPRMSDIRDSGMIETTADVIMLLHPPKDRRNPVCETEIIIAKHRQGETGSALVGYRKTTMCYQAIGLQ